MNIRDDFILKDIHEGYLVGGSVRDVIMGRTFADRDIAIKNADSFALKLAEKLNATFIVLDKENKIYRLVLKDKENYIDIAELRGKTIEEDLIQRDFTINSIAYDLSEDKFIDITGGIKDIKNKKLCQVREENFLDDPLRLLRAYRFMATLGFEIDDELQKIIKKHLLLTKEPAIERVQDEIIKLFGGKFASNTLLKMLDNGMLEILFPQVNEMKLVPPNSHHHLDLIHHVIETVKQIEIQYENASERVLEHLNTINFGGYPRINHLKLAGFLHDIGKYSTWTLESDGITVWKISNGLPYPDNKNLRHRFIKHDSVGAEIANIMLKKMKFSNKQIEYITDMIKCHIYPSNVVASPNLDNKVMMRYIRKMEKNVIDNIILAKADRLSAQGPDVTAEMTKSNIDGLNNLLNFYLEIEPSLKPLPKLIDGHEIMHILNIPPSRKLGRVLDAVHEAQLNGEINSKNEAIDFILKLEY